MSNPNGSWDTVKGFFRRKTQSFGESYRNRNKTTDPTVDQNVNIVFEMQKRMRDLNNHMGGLCNALAQSVSMIELIKEDLAALGNCDMENVSNMGKCMELAVTDLRNKVTQITTAVGKDVESRTQFDRNCDGLKTLLEDRKAKLLEFDFFKNKVAGLRAKPPENPARIPRNEGRVEEWGRAYEAANERVRDLCQQLIGAGSRLSHGTGSMIITETGKYYDESARTARAVLLGQGMQQAVNNAMSNATAAAAVVGGGLSASGAALAQHAASKAAYVEQQTNASGKIPSLPRTQSSGDASNSSFAERGYGGEKSQSSQRFTDDPFAC